MPSREPGIRRRSSLPYAHTLFRPLEMNTTKGRKPLRFPARSWIRNRWWRRLSPSQLFVGSFALLIGLGTLVLALTPSLHRGASLSWLDALFTATSAVCVTGLIVVDTATQFSTAGQGVLLIMIQLGGLGVVTFTTIIILVLGQRLSLRTQQLSSTHIQAAPKINYRLLTKKIARYTLLIEGTGFVLLFLLFLVRFDPLAAAWHAAFHTISAFCNAGFSTFSDSLSGYQTDPMVLLVVAVLIVTGGLGFLTLEELNRWRASHASPSVGDRFRFSFHSRLVLITTGVLILLGWVAFGFAEWRVALAGMPAPSRGINALFMSVTARTAGFNSIDYAQATDTSNFMTIILMLIGGSPGSAAGGIKTTSVAVILLLAWSRMRGHARTGGFGRTVPDETVQRAVGLFVLSALIISAGLLALTLTEMERLPHAQAGGHFFELLFEAISAFNTVGLSLGSTPNLTPTGKLIVIGLMFVGRVGPLTFAAALARRAGRMSSKFRYAAEDVIIG